ncbi:MAG: dihydrodipicolinate synthase family protein [Rhodospirillales bacterium]|nr:dihydrodipicolinate synthase family protein [Rhodospirillales bacterium]
MDKNSVDWHGSIPAMVTPFDADGKFDEPKFRALIELFIKNGVAGLLPSGCTGEFWAMTVDERKALYGVCVDAADGRVPVIAGTAAIRTPDAIELTQAAKEAGCDGAMIMPPYFVKPSTDDIIAHYEAISDAVALPIMLYNIPMYNQTPLTPELVSHLADIDNVVAIKESSFDFNNYYKTQLLCGDRIRVMLGPAGVYGVAAIELGCPGYVEAFPNYWMEPDANRFVEIVEAREMDLARELQRKGLFLTELMNENGRNYYESVKAAMSVLDLPGGVPRLPLRPLGEPHLTEIREGLEKIGITKVAAAAQ